MKGSVRFLRNLHKVSQCVIVSMLELPIMLEVSTCLR